MGFLKQIFTWWDGATIGASLHIRRNGRKVGSDAHGNIYYTAKKGDRRFVMYEGSNDASRVPPEWYAWLLHQLDGPPDEVLPPKPRFLKEATPNLTGTAGAYRPAGALERGGVRAAASGDYEAWTPGEE
ncbi:MAG: NADH:ubiquinone oxidoreductase subunit [Alphaproteobacteria bacterium]|nr:NADH:ubiquinone oxidoreductase subunit [Alphaproteobacteria bacterium]MDB5722959.1 NADH:ubiquinone oxidoreductase subunit [Alphaproteobacteria bacterium]